ncbi:MAG: mechanosensitive ion channel family protein [Cyanobacteriota bacterium]|nr:mechanosensitive ion channel family protein [Cyanobacteriota bacterium]
MALSPESAVPLVAGVVVPFLFKLAGAAALWFVGGWLIDFAMRFLRRSLGRGTMDPTLINYLLSILGALLRVVLVVAILGFFGIETASFAALLAGAGVAIGAAWSGLLGNFAAGAFLQVLRPISVGDYIEAGGVEGTVEEVGMFVTAITSVDNVRHYVGNSKIFGDNIKNFSANPYRRVDLVAQLDNSADVPQAIALLRKGLESIPNQAAGKSPDVEVLEFTERGPKLAVRPYAHTKHYWDVYFDTNRMIVDVLGRAGFPVPRIPLAVQQGASHN